MKTSSAVVLAVTLTVGLIIFFSSMVAVSNHNEHLGTVGDSKFHSLSFKRNFAVSNFSVYGNELTNILRDSLSQLNFTTSTYTQYLRSSIAEEDDTISHDHLEHEMANSNIHPAVPDLEFEAEVSSERLLQNKMSCNVSFEPTCEMYPYVRFWNHRFFPEDCYESPLRHKLKEKAPINEQKFLLFEPDNGGWNNIRMAAEVAMIYAHATGRTLVLPPTTVWYLLDKNSNSEENQSTFDKFFDLSKIKEAITIMPMDEFLSQVRQKVIKLKIPLPEKGVTVAPNHQKRLWRYLNDACFVTEWEPGKIFLGMNITRHNVTQEAVINPIDPAIASNILLPGVTPAMAAADPKHRSRFTSMVAHGRKVYPYTAALNNETAIFFPGDYRNTHRILTHFYTYLYWADYHTEQIYKRIVRDRLHYHDDIFCGAGRVVSEIHKDVAAINKKQRELKITNKVVEVQSLAMRSHKTFGGDTNFNATYFAYHIRRGDFQYKDTRVSAEEIWNNTNHLLDRSVTNLIYIATDERDKSFFKVFLESGFEIRFLDNYSGLARLKEDHNINQNHIGMIEQVVCANAHTFIGTQYSTFTGYITRMRGYYRDGRYERTYYTLKQVMHQLQVQRPIVGPFWAREFEVASKDIDDYYQH